MESTAEVLASKRQRKVETKWTTEEKRLFIEKMEQCTALWDCSTLEYRNRDLKDQQWKKISFEITRSISDCKAQWNTLKSRYNAERNKMNACKSGQGGGRYVSKYEFFSALNFLDSVSSRPAGGTESNMINPSSINIDDADLMHIYGLSEESVIDLDESAHQPPTPKKKKESVESTDRHAVLAKISQLLDKKNADPPKDSWRRAFAEHVFHELSRYSEGDAHQLKRQINRTMDNFDPENRPPLI